MLGLEVVLPDGQVMRTGGRTIKNVAGYDLTSLIVGSEGTLGVVTEITVKLLPKPAWRTTVMGIFAQIDQACEAVNRVITSGVLPLTTEIMDGDCIQAAQRSRTTACRTTPMPCCSSTWRAGPRPRRTRARSSARPAAPPVRARCAAPAMRTRRRRLWAARRSISASLSTLGDKLGEDIAVPRSRIPEMVRRVREIGA